MRPPVPVRAGGAEADLGLDIFTHGGCVSPRAGCWITPNRLTETAPRDYKVRSAATRDQPCVRPPRESVLIGRGARQHVAGAVIAVRIVLKSVAVQLFLPAAVKGGSIEAGGSGSGACAVPERACGWCASHPGGRWRQRNPIRPTQRGWLRPGLPPSSTQWWSWRCAELARPPPVG